MEFIFIVVIILLLILSYFVANGFYNIAKEKGYYGKKYFWICFLLALPGWLMVIALPDKNLRQILEDNCVSNDSTEDSFVVENQSQSKVEGFASGVMNIPKRK